MSENNVNSEQSLTEMMSSARGRLDQAFENAETARDLLVELSKDPRFEGDEFSDLREKIDAARSAVDVVMSHT
ncbi:MAG: hypothetical protein AB2777_22000 [Candidatus Thiodiazotropha endolucinida]